MACALFAFLAALQKPAGSARRWLFLGFYAAMALATLTKGLIGFALTGLVAFVWVLAFNRWRLLWPFYPVSGIALFLAIAAPWHVMAARANADFLHFYFVHEHYLRFTTTVHDRTAPWWYFGPVLLAGLLPWTFFLPQALRANLEGGRMRRDWATVWFFIVWTATILLFFSKSQSKLAPYITPVFPALALLIGRYLAERTRGAGLSQGVRTGLWCFVGLAALLAVAMMTFPVSRRYAYLSGVVAPWRPVLAGLLGAGAVAVAVLTRRGDARRALAAVVVAFGAFLISTNFVIGLVDTRSSKALALALKPQLRTGDAVYCVGEYFQDFPVYLQRQVHVVGYEGELGFGIKAEPERTVSRFIDTRTFAERWKGPEVAYALVQTRYRKGFFEDANLPCAVVAETPRYTLLRNISK